MWEGCAANNAMPLNLGSQGEMCLRGENDVKEIMCGAGGRSGSEWASMI